MPKAKMYHFLVHESTWYLHAQLGDLFPLLSISLVEALLKVHVSVLGHVNMSIDDFMGITNKYLTLLI